MIDLELKNKRVVVVGGSNGIGLQIVNKFLEQGSEVHCISRNKKYEIETKLNKAYCDKIFFHYCNATNLDSVNNCCNEIIQRGSIDILISNVGDGRVPNNDINELDIWRESWKINFDTGLNVAKIFSKQIKDTKTDVLSYFNWKHSLWHYSDNGNSSCYRCKKK